MTKAKDRQADGNQAWQVYVLKALVLIHDWMHEGTAGKSQVWS